MKWRSEKDKAALLSFEEMPNLVALAEAIGEAYESEVEVPDLSQVSPFTFEELGQAMTVVVGYAEYGNEFYESLTWIERSMVDSILNQYVLYQQKIAQDSSHRGEGDEGI